MIFGEVALDHAEGAILAHSIALSKGGRIRKGKMLTATDIALLRTSDIHAVIVARLQEGDVHEDAAAARIGAALCGAGLRANVASTGRVNLYAEAAGVVDIDRDTVDAVNAIDPMITIATVGEWQRVREGGMVATVKIISYAVADKLVVAAEEAARNALRLRGLARRRVSLIETGGAISPRAAEAIGGRLARMGAELSAHVATVHECDAIARAFADASGDLILLLTETATSDPADVGPEGLRRAGGTVTRFGMPVDPGNLLFFGDLKGKPVIGLPGCARSPALNGADWILERMICGVPVPTDSVARMGVGGLLKEIPERRAPREAPERE